MKKLLLAAGSVLAVTASANAADLGAMRTPIGAAIAVPAGFNWTGFYIGGHVGGNSTRNRHQYNDTPPGALDGWFDESFGRTLAGLVVGLQAGYNWQLTSNFVVGLEGSLSYSSARSTFATPGGVFVINAVDTYRTQNTFLGNLSVRAGYAFDRALFFGKVGLAVGSFGYRQSDPFEGSFSSTSTRAGLLVGGGIEYAVTPNWTIGAEYNYNMFASGNSPVSTTTVRTSTNVHVAKVTLNYLFSTGASPISARY